MKVSSSSQDDATPLEQIGHWRHELLTPLNHILGLTEIHIDDAPDTGIQDYVPALAEINAGGRHLLAMIESGIDPFSSPSDLLQLAGRLQSEAGRALPPARKLALELRAISPAAAEDLVLVASALDKFISICHEVS